jgi:hypothetical protein
MLLKPGVNPSDYDFLIRYYDRVRQTVGNFDSLVVDILAKGATVVIAILVLPLSLLHFSGGQGDKEQIQSVYRLVSWISMSPCLHRPTLFLLSPSMRTC